MIPGSSFVRLVAAEGPWGGRAWHAQMVWVRKGLARASFVRLNLSLKTCLRLSVGAPAFARQIIMPLWLHAHVTRDDIVDGG